VIGRPIQAENGGGRVTDLDGQGTARDREEILAHIRGIFAAYIRQDRDAIRRTHSRDWTGFQNPSVKIERGIEDYMRNAETSLQTLRGTGFELIDTEMQFYGALAVVFYVARYDYEHEGRKESVPLRSVDLYRREADGWIQCGSHISVIPSAPSWTTTG
jgi:ketosteroid isomerase-like protein